MINVKLIEILNGQQALAQLALKEISAVISYNIAKAIAVSNEEIRLFNDVKDNIFKKYLKDGASEITDSYDIQACNNEINELANNTITLQCSKINIKDLEKLELSAGLLYSIMWLIED